MRRKGGAPRTMQSRMYSRASASGSAGYVKTCRAEPGGSARCYCIWLLHPGRAQVIKEAGKQKRSKASHTHKKGPLNENCWKHTHR